MIHIKKEIAGLVIDLIIALNKAERGHTCEVVMGDKRVKGRITDSGSIMMEWFGLEEPLPKSKQAKKNPSKPKP